MLQQEENSTPVVQAVVMQITITEKYSQEVVHISLIPNKR